ncbi:uncharacterized protein LOC127281510 [Leptopilina boulardi]|uniref:uncharacterized protein LOC127281510 n=1 Tax=Leptopilina boulardi TaxID=63433 RepID=UPI0021F55727|nr:uncharacterized protein LOC127281510 [Leptopilina boulardi]
MSGRKNLRTIRKLNPRFIKPRNDELMHFKEAYKIDENPKFAVNLAQCLKESKNNSEAMIIFEELYKKNWKSVTIQLRLALVFIKTNKLDNAEKCLDYVESVAPEKSMFLHYKGLYLMKKNNMRKLRNTY